MKNTKDKPICADELCEVTFTKFRTTDKYCSYECKIKNTPLKNKKKKYRIPKFSKKQKSALAKYFKIRADFMNGLDNIICPVCPNKTVTDVHHKMGKEGFADEWAKKNDIPLLIDTRFFLAVSREGHSYIEYHPVWAKKMGYSIDRLTIK